MASCQIGKGDQTEQRLRRTRILERTLEGGRNGKLGFEDGSGADIYEESRMRVSSYADADRFTAQTDDGCS